MWPKKNVKIRTTIWACKKSHMSEDHTLEEQMNIKLRVCPKMEIYSNRDTWTMVLIYIFGDNAFGIIRYEKMV